jgi:hypothetical protein
MAAAARCAARAPPTAAALHGRGGEVPDPPLQIPPAEVGRHGLCKELATGGNRETGWGGRGDKDFFCEWGDQDLEYQMGSTTI